MQKDAQGHSVSDATADAIEAIDQAVRAFTLVHGDAIKLYDTARELAPGCAMAHLGKAWIFALANDPVMAGLGRPLLATARTLTLNTREQAHLAALDHAIEGHREAARAVLDRHLMTFPHDLVAHQAAALLDGFLGRFHWVRDRVRQGPIYYLLHQISRQRCGLFYKKLGPN